MLQVLTIYKSDVGTNNSNWKDLLIDSYNYVHKSNDFPDEIEDTKDLNEFWKYLNRDNVQIVLRQNKYIGFFYNPYDSLNKTISTVLFPYSRACPMASRSLAKCGIIRSLLMYLYSNHIIEKFEFHTWHPSLVQVAKTLLPVQVHSVTSDYFVAYSELNATMITVLSKILISYLEIHDNTSIDYDEFKVIR